MERNTNSGEGLIFTMSHSLNFIIILLIFSFCKNNSGNTRGYTLNELQVNYDSDSTNIISIGYLSEFGEDGEWLYFDKSGRLEKIQNFNKGVLNGPVTEFLCCKKFSEYTYKDGVLDGEIVYYSSDGSITTKGNFKDGEMAGLWTEFLKGKLISITCFIDGNEISIFKSENYNETVSGNEFFGCCVK
jgi:antitoxin component YwqK of YwqJK toxin-antitoxin module